MKNNMIAAKMQKGFDFRCNVVIRFKNNWKGFGFSKNGFVETWLNFWSHILTPGFGSTLFHSKLCDALLFSDNIHLCNLCCKLLYFFVLGKLWPNDKFGKRVAEDGE